MQRLNLKMIHSDKVHFLANPVGSGKTQAALDTIRLNDTESHIFVSPTNILAKEIYDRMIADLADSSIVEHIQIINGETIKVREGEMRKKTVSEEALFAIRNQDIEQPHILILSTETFRNILTRISNNDKARYNIYLDEGIEVLDRVEVKGLLDYDNETGEITIGRGQRELIMNIAEQNDRALGTRGELCHSKFSEIARMLTSDLYRVYGTIGEGSIRCVGMLEADQFLAFKSVIMIVALFEQSPLALYWKKSKGIKFEELNHSCTLFDTHKEKGHLISVYHVLHPDDNASKAVITTELEGVKVFLQVGKIVEEFFAVEGKKYCYAVNNFFGNPQDNMPTGEKMPVKCAGLNNWKDIDNVAALSTCLPETWVKDVIIKLLGVSGQEFYQLWRMAGTYQTVGRCSLRNRDKNDPITIVVLSQEEAKDLHKLFEGSKYLGQLGNMPSVKQFRSSKKSKKAYSVPDNNAFYRYRKNCLASKQAYLDKETWYREIRLKRQMVEELA